MLKDLADQYKKGIRNLVEVDRATERINWRADEIYRGWSIYYLRKYLQREMLRIMQIETEFGVQLREIEKDPLADTMEKQVFKYSLVLEGTPDSLESISGIRLFHSSFGNLFELGSPDLYGGYKLKEVKNRRVRIFTTTIELATGIVERYITSMGL